MHACRKLLPGRRRARGGAPKRARPKQRIANLVAEPSETVTLPVKGPSNTRCTRFPKAASPQAAL